MKRSMHIVKEKKSDLIANLEITEVKDRGIVRSGSSSGSKE